MPCGFCVPQLQQHFGIRTRNVTCRSNKESHSLISKSWNGETNVQNLFFLKKRNPFFIYSGTKLWSLHSLNIIKAKIPPLCHNLATYIWVKVTIQAHLKFEKKKGVFTTFLWRLLQAPRSLPPSSLALWSSENILTWGDKNSQSLGGAAATCMGVPLTANRNPQRSANADYRGSFFSRV